MNAVANLHWRAMSGEFSADCCDSSKTGRSTPPFAHEKRFDSIGSAPADIVRVGLRSDAGALSIGAFGRSRWRLRWRGRLRGFELRSRRRVEPDGCPAAGRMSVDEAHEVARAAFLRSLATVSCCVRPVFVWEDTPLVCVPSHAEDSDASNERVDYDVSTT